MISELISNPQVLFLGWLPLFHLCRSFNYIFGLTWLINPPSFFCMPVFGFCFNSDEPTSGLDAFQALSVMSSMKELAGKRADIHL